MSASHTTGFLKLLLTVKSVCVCVCVCVYVQGMKNYSREIKHKLDRCLNIVGRAFAKYDDMYACIVNITHAKIMLFVLRYIAQL